MIDDTFDNDDEGCQLNNLKKTLEQVQELQGEILKEIRGEIKRKISGGPTPINAGLTSKVDEIQTKTNEMKDMLEGFGKQTKGGLLEVPTNKSCASSPKMKQHFDINETFENLVVVSETSETDNSQNLTKMRSIDTDEEMESQIVDLNESGENSLEDGVTPALETIQEIDEPII